MEPKLITTISWNIVFSENSHLETLDRTPSNVLSPVFHFQTDKTTSILFAHTEKSLIIQRMELELTLTLKKLETPVLSIILYSIMISARVGSIWLESKKSLKKIALEMKRAESNLALKRTTNLKLKIISLFLTNCPWSIRHQSVKMPDHSFSSSIVASLKLKKCTKSGQIWASLLDWSH